ncbi:hypothetical protein FACS189456_0790 [Bacteroidia bacterium]|nr:hypothetical protein FACS189456_0790 [Bacteroidia bacterium]
MEHIKNILADICKADLSRWNNERYLHHYFSQQVQQFYPVSFANSKLRPEWTTKGTYNDKANNTGNIDFAIECKDKSALTAIEFKLFKTWQGIGSSSLSDRGFLYSEMPNPSIDNGAIKKSMQSGGVGIFEATLTGLTAQTTYYVIPYAINGRGTAYGEQERFDTGDASTPGGGGSATVPDNVICVSIVGNDANSGNSWSKAKKTIAAAVQIAAEGQQIWVSAGTYNETLTPKDGIPVYGGFKGSETAISQRTERTTISAINTYDYYVEDEWGEKKRATYTKTTIINGFSTKNSVSLSSYTRLENTVISEVPNNGYTISCSGSVSNIVMADCQIKGNNNQSLSYGGDKLTLINCIISGNPTVGGVQVSKMYGCVVTNNHYIPYATHNYNCTFASNAGALPNSAINLYNCVVWNNGEVGSSVVQYSSLVLGTNNSQVKFKNPSTTRGYQAADWQTADWSLDNGSTCIDAGTSLYFPADEIPIDVAGNARINGATIDIGAHEY